MRIDRTEAQLRRFESHCIPCRRLEFWALTCKEGVRGGESQRQGRGSHSHGLVGSFCDDGLEEELWGAPNGGIGRAGEKLAWYWYREHLFG